MTLQRIIWLASFPKSGNTWLRSFLAQYFMPDGKAPDINSLRDFTTADVRQDFFDRAVGGRFVAADFDHWLRTRVKAVRLIAGSKSGHHFVKTHCQVQRIGPVDVIDPAVTAAAIYVLRNPFDVAPSYARHLGLSLDEAIDKMLSPQSLNSTETRIFEIVGRWDDHVASWQAARGLPQHVMRYEDMKADTERAFRGLLGFLQAPVKDGKLRRAIRETSFDALRKQEDSQGFVERPAGMEKFFAKGQSGAWRDDLTPGQVARLREGFLPAIERWYPELVEETADVAAKA
ncbi:MAG: sulfotransferase domain-containing protein [Pseudomonadota bacterium]